MLLLVTHQSVNSVCNTPVSGYFTEDLTWKLKGKRVCTPAVCHYPTRTNTVNTARDNRNSCKYMQQQDLSTHIYTESNTEHKTAELVSKYVFRTE